jgi:transcription initiation factor IIE alpha subunit
MGFSDIIASLRPNRRAKVTGHAHYILTALGKKKVTHFELENEPTWNVAGYLDEHGESTLRDICDGLGIKEEKARRILRTLMNSGYVCEASSGN